MSRIDYPSTLVTAFFALVCGALSAGSASAQMDPFAPGAQLLSGFLGPSFDLGGEEEGREGEEGIEFESEWLFGGSYDYFLTSKLSLQASVAFATGEGELEGPGGDDAEDDDGGNGDDESGEEEEDENGEGELGANGIHLTGALTYHFRPEGRVRPYVTGGGGLVRIDVEGTSESRPAGVFGGGVLIGLSRSLLVRVDARDTLYTLDTGGGSTTENDVSLTGGLSFRF